MVLIVAMAGLSCDGTSSKTGVKNVSPEVELQETERAIHRATQALEDLHDVRTQAVSDSLRLPGDIKEAEERIKVIDRELAQAEAYRQQAERDRAEFVKANANRLESLELQVRQEADREYQAAVREIAESRRKREEQRKRTGSQAEDQEEALFVRREERKARTRIDATATAVVEKERSRLSGRFREYSEGIAAASQVLQELSAERDQAIRWLEETRSHVRTAKEVADASPAEISTAEERLKELTARRDVLQTSIAEAQREQERERQLAEVEARRIATEAVPGRLKSQSPSAHQQAYFAARRLMTAENTKRLQQNRVMRNSKAQAIALDAELEMREKMARLRPAEQLLQMPGPVQSPRIVPFANGLENGYVRIDGPLSTVVHSNGTIQQHYRDGDWVYYRDNVGGTGAQFNDRARQVQRYDFRNSIRGTRTIGENPYGSASGTQRWSVRMAPDQ